MSVYQIIEPKGKKVPILISSPHSGDIFPENLQGLYQESHLQNPDDADWFVDKLYDFASEMGITIIKAVYHRWVIDLNRSPENTSLYNDGRVITGLTPHTNFLGENIYKGGYLPRRDDIQERLDKYYKPYHQKIEQILDSFQEDFEHVLLYEAHSIRRSVPSISKNPFPDLMLGDNEGNSAHTELSQIATKNFSSSEYSFEHNFLFKGGYLTRSFGQPEHKRHALQLERSKDIYMSDNELDFDEKRADKLKTILKKNLEDLRDWLLGN